MLMEDCQKGLLPSGADSSVVSLDKWLIAERRVREILWAIQPNVASEWRRRELISYIQRVIRGGFGTEVLPFGSVPLKTYLPDGDIDLTVLCHRNKEEDLAQAICNLLEGEPKEPGFLVKDVRFVCAKVRIIKCTVNNIAVDISFNQVAGLSTLCFLEQVDQIVGRDHLFKRSIILIKTWCYHESRTLGAPHGLLSTYALETLVLCVINIFHPSVHGPLQVLLKFLEYYSAFDWANYCLSLNGPISISSIIKGDTPDNQVDNSLLTKEFLKKCRIAFSDPRRIQEARLQEFPLKRLNIVDPLKDDNNLGRSITTGNFTRIRSAFEWGKSELTAILELPGERIGQYLQSKFFRCTLDRNGRGQRPDLPGPVPAFGSGRCLQSNLTGDYDYYYGGMLYAQALHDQRLHLPSHPSRPPSQVQNNTTWNARTGPVEQQSWNVYDRMSMNPYALPVYHHCGSQQIAAIGRFPGTGTYIPEASRHYRSSHSRTRGRVQPRTRRLMNLPSQVHPAGMPGPSLQSQVPPQSSEDLSNTTEVSELGVSEPASSVQLENQKLFQLDNKEFPPLGRTTSL